MAHKAGATVIIATHDQQMINEHDGRIVRLVKGRMDYETINADILLQEDYQN